MLKSLEPSDPRQLGPYELIGRIGSGGMGQVFLGRSQGGRLVAVKAIHPEHAEDPLFRTRFRREAAAAKKVSGFYTPGDRCRSGRRSSMARDRVPFGAFSR